MNKTLDFKHHWKDILTCQLSLSWGYLEKAARFAGEHGFEYINWNTIIYYIEYKDGFLTQLGRTQFIVDNFGDIVEDPKWDIHKDYDE